VLELYMFILCDIFQVESSICWTRRAVLGFSCMAMPPELCLLLMLSTFS
jgi:hypothetical protein